MPKKALWLLLTALLVVALILSSCKQTTTEQPGESPTTVTGATQQPGTTTPTPGTTTPGTTGPEMVKDSLGRTVEKPRYGGKITLVWTGPVPTQIWDPIVSTRAATTAVHVYGRLGSLDWAKGPSGTGEYTAESTYIPDEYLGGELAESWERPDTRSIVFKLKKGVMWQSKAPMNGREVTADDVVYSWLRGQGNPQSVFYTGKEVPVEQKLKIEALDKYTVKYSWYQPDGRMVHSENQWMYIQPKEAIAQFGNLDNWRNAVGFGPFTVQDVVPDSSALFKRNPNYFQSDPFFPQNQLPYVDFVEALVIQDESTRVSAMRTHKIDIYPYFPWDKAAKLAETNPELKMRKMTPDYGSEIFMRTDIAPFSDKRVRQALQYALDEPSIANDYFKGDAVILAWPVQSFFKTHYTPLDQLPADLQKMYTYDPDTARKLLADAGLPTGFKTEIAVAATWAKGIEQLAMLKENWKAAGIEVEIKPTEAATFGSLIYGKKFPAMCFSTWGNNGVDDVFGWAHDGWVGAGGAKSVYAFSSVNDPVATETYRKLMDTLDFNEREKIRKEENIREIDLAWEISLPVPNSYTFWVPWVKGYSGESGVGPDPPEFGGVTRYVWVDRAMKTQLTGIKD